MNTAKEIGNVLHFRDVFFFVSALCNHYGKNVVELEAGVSRVELSHLTKYFTPRSCFIRSVLHFRYRFTAILISMQYLCMILLHFF